MRLACAVRWGKDDFMNFSKPFFRYLCTVALVDILAGAAVRQGSASCRAYPEAVLLLLMLPGGVFLLGLACGVIWGRIPGLRWRTAAAYSFVTLLAFPLPYYLPYGSEEFWILFWYANGQQCAGFVLGAWCSIDCMRRRERETAGSGGEG